MVLKFYLIEYNFLVVLSRNAIKNSLVETLIWLPNSELELR